MALSITPRLIMEAAEKRGWRTVILDDDLLLYRLELPDGRTFYLRGITSIKTASINTFIADRKEIMARLMVEIGVPVPETARSNGDFDEALAFLQKHGVIVVKPASQSHGNGVTVGVSSSEKLSEALTYARSFGKTVLLQQHVTGDDYRLLYIGGKLAAAAVREPASVVGDGVQTLLQLISAENESPGRVTGYGSLLTKINIEAASRYLGNAGNRVPLKNEKVQVVGTANIGQGGIAIDVTDTIDPAVVQIADKIIAHFGIGVCGVDFIIDAEGNPYLIEINAGPSLGLHEHPFIGEARHTPDLFLDWLTEA